MPAPKKQDKTVFTQSITINARVKFADVNSGLDRIALKNGTACPGSGMVLDKLIQKYAHLLTMEDFAPDMFVGNELKQSN